MAEAERRIVRRSAERHKSAFSGKAKIRGRYCRNFQGSEECGGLDSDDKFRQATEDKTQSSGAERLQYCSSQMPVHSFPLVVWTGTGTSYDKE